MAISVPPKGDNDKRIGAYFAPLLVEAQTIPSMTVKVRPGGFWTNMGEYRPAVYRRDLGRRFCRYEKRAREHTGKLSAGISICDRRPGSELFTFP